MQKPFEIWTVYRGTFPQIQYRPGYQARRFDIVSGKEPIDSGVTYTCVDLDPLREPLESRGLVKLMRSEQDDPSIIESWI